MNFIKREKAKADINITVLIDETLAIYDDAKDISQHYLVEDFIVLLLRF